MKRSEINPIAFEGRPRQLAFTLAVSLLALGLWSAAAPAAGLPGFSVLSAHDLPGFEPVEPGQPAAKTAPPSLKSSDLPDTKRGHGVAAEAREG
jgi:hypothetical protein